MSKSVSRRHFIQTAGAAGAAFTIAGSSLNGFAKGVGPNDKINLAIVGCAGRGGGISQSIHKKGHTTVVAMCDVDMGSKKVSELTKKFPDVPKFKDFRKMFDKMGDKIDAVTIGVPDHSHFPIAMLAMSMGKHIYVEKPLAHTFQEVELMMAAEKKYGVSAQMGNQGHSGNNYFQFKSWVEAGIIKDVTHVDACMNKSRRWHGWTNPGYLSGEEMPETLDWDLWTGTAPNHPYSAKLHPGNWRSWYDYGNGAFGVWGPHTLDTIHRFLDLGLPYEVSAVKLEGSNDFYFPQASTISFKFPARGEMPPVEIVWYDGVENLPPIPKELEGRKMNTCGKVIYSKELIFQGGTHSDTLRIIPEAKMREMAPELPKISGKNSDHSENFVLACKGEEKTRSSFDISGPLTQVFLLGVIAQRLGGTLKFDRKTKQITNNKIANQLLAGPPPRPGWEEFYTL